MTSVLDLRRNLNWIPKELKKHDADAYQRHHMTSGCELLHYWSKD